MRLGRAERGAVVEVGAAVPVAIPRLLEHRRHSLALSGPTDCARRVPARSHQRGEIVKDLRQEPAEPDALAAALVSDTVHAVVPVPGADQGKAMRADGEPTLDGADAVLVE